MRVTTPPVEITENLVMLGTDAYPLYLVKGEHEGILFEAGTGAMGPLLREQMERLGIGADFVKQVIIPHAHPDHVMAVPLFREIFPDVTVTASQAAANTLSAEKAIGFFRQVDDALTASLTQAGLITEQHHPRPFADKQIAVDRIIQEGDAVALDGVSFRVLETPGHSDCSLSFYEPDGRLLLASDATAYYLPEHDAWWPNYFSDYAAYLGSMRRLAELEAEILCPGHQGAVKGAEDVRSYLAASISATEEYHGRIIAEAKAGKPVRRIAEELGCEVYEKTQLLPVEFFQKNCGLMVKHSLRHAGMSVNKT